MEDNVKLVDKLNINSGNLFQSLEQAQSVLESFLLRELNADGPVQLGRGDLKILANLDCRSTYASELARRLGVSRQAVNRLLRNLIALDLVQLEADPDRKNTKRIVITDEGAAFIEKALHHISEFEARLKARIGSQRVEALKSALAEDWRQMLFG